MSETIDVAEQFDRISQVYDETREPLKEAAVEKIKNTLLRDGCSSVVEVGVGTGRVAKPLQERNFEKAREKGVLRLMLADADYLPLKNKSFDAAILAHVLQIFENAAEVFGRIIGVVKKDVIALVRKRDDARENDGNGVMRRIFEQASAEMGYALPECAGEWRRKENEFTATVPPTELITIQDELIETSVDERLSYFEKRAFRYSLDIPDEIIHKIIRGVRSSSDTEGKISV